MAQPLLTKNRLLLGLTVTLFEALDPASGIDELLLTGKERMAFGANFNPDVLFSGTGLKFCTTSTTNGRFFVVGMDSLFHWVSHLFLLCTD